MTNIEKSLRRSFIATFSGIALLILTCIWLALISLQNHDSLCAFRNGLASDFYRTEAYIQDVQAGRRRIIPGISIADLQAAQKARKARLDDLSSLDCSRVWFPLP